ncbi:alkyl sulfatase [Leptodontidium sp. 2 PMI_412]|nr:alkyl sulfatase [Leptodontidium sp. 2 PMI_412]
MYPPDDQTDIDSADTGLKRSLNPCIIASSVDPSRTVWNNDAYAFILNNDCPEDFANHSLWRQSKLCARQGLYAVVDPDDHNDCGIYQVRGLDISNMSFIETISTNGVVVVDPLTSYECAQQALLLYQEERPGKVIRAMIYTHSHVDHFGGAVAITEAARAQKVRRLPIYAPDGFLEHAVSENVYAGNAMGRRALYMYGESLKPEPAGQIGTGLGMATSTGVITPGTEAPSEMNFHFPQYRATCMAENATHTLHNIQTLRGAVVRDARVWSRYLDEAIVLYGKDTDVVFASHHWPTFGNPEVLTFLGQQRDLYAYMHNETLRQLNAGQTGLEIAEDFPLPASLESLWCARGYYGSISHNVKAIYNRYMGWFDGNPAHLWEHPPKEAALRYVKCMGGIQKVIAMGIEFHMAGDLRFAATLLNHAVFADQSNAAAKKALSATYKALGYGAENATWRNFYLTGAQELTEGITKALNSMSPESYSALSMEQLVDTMAIRIDGPAASGETFTIDVMVTDTKAGYHMNMSNSALTHHSITYLDVPGVSDPAASLTIYPNFQQFVDLVNGEQKDLSGIPISGDAKVWDTLSSLLTQYDTGFAIVTPDEP